MYKVAYKTGPAQKQLAKNPYQFERLLFEYMQNRVHYQLMDTTLPILSTDRHLMSTLATIVAEFGDYSRQCGRGLRKLLDGVLHDLCLVGHCRTFALKSPRN